MNPEEPKAKMRPFNEPLRLCPKECMWVYMIGLVWSRRIVYRAQRSSHVITLGPGLYYRAPCTLLQCFGLRSDLMFCNDGIG